MQQVVFANGKLWGALDTALTLNSVNKASIEWFIVKPSVSSSGVSGSVALQGYLGLANNNLTYPAIGVTNSGRGVMAFTVVGGDYYQSAGYAGAGPADGFTSYKAFVGNPPRTRWGDYGAAVADGNTIWTADEWAETRTVDVVAGARIIRSDPPTRLISRDRRRASQRNRCPPAYSGSQSG